MDIARTLGWFLAIAISIGILIAVLYIIREIICWYFKINEQLEKQERIIALLEQLIDQEPVAPSQK